MGSTRRTQSNTTNQIDSRRIYETNLEYDHRLEDSFNQTTEFDIQDESQGNITAGGNVTVESEAASIAASEAAEAAAEEARRIAEANAELQERLAEEQRRTAEINARLEEARAEDNRRIAEANAAAQERFAEEQRRATESALSSNSSVSRTAIKEARKTSESAIKGVVEISDEALKRNSMHVQEVLAAGRDNVTDTLKFLEEDEQEDRKLIQSNFEFLGETIEENNKLTTTALTEAFKSTVGGLADEQQKTLLIGLAIVSALLVLANWRKK